MKTGLYRLRRAVGVQIAGICALLMVVMGGLDPAWGLDKAGALMGIAAESALPVKYTLDEKNGTISWMSGQFQPAVPGDLVESAYVFLESHRKAFQVQNPREEFTLMSVRKGLLKPTDHVYLEQKIKGIPVWNRRLGFHYDQQGRLYAVNGKYSNLTQQENLVARALLTPEQAFQRAWADVQRISLQCAGVRTAAKGVVVPIRLKDGMPRVRELVYYPDTQETLRLCYRVEFGVVSPVGEWIYFVDAVTGVVLHKLNNIQTSGPAVGSGMDLYNNVVSLNTYLDTDGKYKLVDTSKTMYSQHTTNHPSSTFQGCIEIRDAAHSEDPSASCTAISDPDGDNVFTSGGSDPKQNYQPAVSLARNFASSYDLFASLYNRNSVDGHGLSMIGYIHLGTKYENAYWDPVGKMMYFGDNSDTGWPYPRADEVVCHEAAHGINTFEVPPYGYTYHKESGAINDSLSDISGAMLDYGDWNVGEDVAKDGQPMRRFDDPAAVADPQPKDMYDLLMMTKDLDHGGVHWNCSIGNYFVYQLAMRLPAESPASDGRFTAGRVAYRSYVYGTANPEVTHREWGQYLKQAAVDLYGPGDIYDKVVEALDVVHIPQALVGINDNWQYKIGDDGLPFFFALYRISVYNSVPVVSMRFTRPSTDAKLKTVAMNLTNLDPYSKFRIWYIGANSDGSPDEDTAQLLFDNNSPSVIRSDGIFNNFKLTNSISVASDFHVALDIYEGSYLGIYYDTGDPAAGRSWYKYYSWGYPYWAKFAESNNLLIRVIYETTPLSAPSAPTLVSPANGATVNDWQIPFSWNSVSGADRYFLEVNSSSSWDESGRVFFATVTTTSQTTAGFPVGLNYWRVWAGNADAWSCASETRSFTETVQPPTLSCSVSSMSASATPAQAAFDQSFNVGNSGNGIVTYAITDDAGWLSISPTNGTSTGESDAINVTYNPSGLSTGVYSATITVSASGAYGSPKTIAVTFTVLDMIPLAADFDGDAKADPAIVMSGAWYVWLSSCGYYRLGPFGFSESGWTPAAGDFDGDRLADPSGMDASGKWYVRFSSSGYMQGGGYPLGDVSYSPLIADFDGDGYADTAGMSAGGEWLIWFSGSGYLRGGPYPFGGSGCAPRAGDFDGDRLADPAAVSAGGEWLIWFSSSGYLRGGPYAFGASGLTAVAGDFDGDRRSDTAGTDCAGRWYLWLSSAGYQMVGPVVLTLP